MSPLLKQTLRASFMWQVDGKVVFSHGDEDKPDFFYLDANAWFDMNKPKIIMIQVMPGDELNEG